MWTNVGTTHVRRRTHGSTMSFYHKSALDELLGLQEKMIAGSLRRYVIKRVPIVGRSKTIPLVAHRNHPDACRDDVIDGHPGHVHIKDLAFDRCEREP